jgi:AraC-like DNA-binding protein
LTLPAPDHPLVSVIDFQQVEYAASDIWKQFILNVYCVALKKEFRGKMKYGQNYYDFDEGVMTFTAPGQVISVNDQDKNVGAGYMLVFHSDLVRDQPLGKHIKEYGYFSYAVTEALHLSGEEEQLIEVILKNIEREYLSVTDRYNQPVITSYIELLLNYSDRFYNRQFVTRKNRADSLLAKTEVFLSDYFSGDKTRELGLPSVEYVSAQLHVSPNYLSDLLRTLTGQNTQQHIHHCVIEKAKEILLGTNLSVSEIAYQLGFGYPQSFSRLFKHKTNLSPMEFRRSFNCTRDAENSNLS